MIIGHSLSDPNGVILHMDEAMTDFLQHSQRAVVGKSYLAITHADDRLRNARQVDGLTGDDAPLRIRKRYVRGDGVSVWIDARMSRLKLGSDRGRLIGSFELLNLSGDRRHPRRLWRTASDLLAMDVIRKERLGTDIFGDHAWTILIHIYLAEAEGRSVDCEMLGALTALPAAVIGRWLDVLESRGLVELADGARQLTPDGIERLERIFVEVGK